MDVFQELCVTIMAALILSCIIVKLVSGAVSNDEKIGRGKVVVEEESKVVKGLVVKSKKSKKRVKFLEKEVVKHVDRFETYGVDQSVDDKEVSGITGEEKVGSEEVFVEGRNESLLKKEEVFGTPVEVEQCCAEREVSDGHDDGELSKKIGSMEEKVEGKEIDKLVDVVEKENVNALVLDGERSGNLLKKEEVLERGMSDGHEEEETSKKIELMEEKVEVRNRDELLDVVEKENVDALVLDGEKSGNLLKKEEGLGTTVEVEQCCGERLMMSDGHDDGDRSKKFGLMEEKVEVKKIDESLEEEKVNALVLDGEKNLGPNLVDDKVKVVENEVVELGGELSKRDEKTDKMVMDEDIDDDWEGVERSELEEEFSKAFKFVDGGKGIDGNLDNLGNELMMQLYGLQKVAMEGPCHEPQPMALKITARAKWNES